MRLRKLLKHIDFLGDIKIVEYSKKQEVEEVLYKGTVFGVPWSIADMKLDTSIDYEAVGIVRDSDDKVILEVAVTEE